MQINIQMNNVTASKDLIEEINDRLKTIEEFAEEQEQRNNKWEQGKEALRFQQHKHKIWQEIENKQIWNSLRNNRRMPQEQVWLSLCAQGVIAQQTHLFAEQRASLEQLF